MIDNYKFNDNTLIHSAGFDFSKFCSILQEGIMSFNYAKEKGVLVNKNYDGYNFGDTISCVRYLYVNGDMKDSAYCKYVKQGISFIIEDVDFIYDKDDRVINKSDEVLVKDYITVSKIKGILIPEEYMDARLTDLSYIRDNATSYVLINNNVNNIKKFIADNSGVLCDTYYDDIMRELYAINEAYRVSKSLEEQEFLKDDFREAIRDLNTVIGEDFERCFIKKIGKEDISLFDVTSYLNSKYGMLPIYELPSKSKIKK